MNSVAKTIDAAVGCVLCGARMGGCDCWDKTLSRGDVHELVEYARFRGARGERERIVRYIRKLAASTDTTFARWSAQLSALATRLEKQRPRQRTAQVPPHTKGADHG